MKTIIPFVENYKPAHLSAVKCPVAFIYETGFVNKTMPFYITAAKKNELSNHFSQRNAMQPKKYFPELIERTQNLRQTFFFKLL